MTKLTGLDLYLILDTLLHSMAFTSWTGCATEKAREELIKKLQRLLNEMEMSVVMEDENA
jgi:hypothetical protein